MGKIIVTEEQKNAVKAVLTFGKSTPKTQDVLASETGISARRVRGIIQVLRLEGLPVSSSRSGKKGYYIAISADEIRELIRFCEANICANQRIKTAAEIRLAAMVNVPKLIEKRLEVACYQ